MSALTSAIIFTGGTVVGAALGFVFGAVLGANSERTEGEPISVERDAGGQG